MGESQICLEGVRCGGRRSVPVPDVWPSRHKPIWVKTEALSTAQPQMKTTPVVIPWIKAKLLIVWLIQVGGFTFTAADQLANQAEHPRG